MKQLLLILTLCSLSFAINAQDITVDSTAVVSTVDGLIEKYSPKLEAAFKEIFEFAKVTGKQAIDIFYRYLLFQYIFWISLFILFLITGIYLLKRCIPVENDKHIAGTIFGTFFGIVGVIGTLIWSYWLLLLLIVPEVAIIKEALELIK